MCHAGGCHSHPQTVNSFLCWLRKALQISHCLGPGTHLAPGPQPLPPPGRLWARVRDTTSRGGQVAPLTHPPELTFAWPEASPREQNTEPHVGPEWGCRAPKNNRWGEGNPELGGSHWREMSTEGKGSDAPADVYKIRKQVWRTTVKKA